MFVCVCSPLGAGWTDRGDKEPSAQDGRGREEEQLTADRQGSRNVHVCVYVCVACVCRPG